MKLAQMCHTSAKPLKIPFTRFLTQTNLKWSQETINLSYFEFHTSYERIYCFKKTVKILEFFISIVKID